MKKARYFNLNHYKLGEKIGNGTFGKVYKVQDKRRNKIFAAKILKKEIEELDQNHINYITREINIMSKLKHPSIVNLIGFSPKDFKGNPKPVIVTELVKEGTLTKFIELERLSRSDPKWDDTHKLIALYGIASAMSFLHEHNIIHRDLKPDNILMDENLYPKICDFGLSKIDPQSTENISFESESKLKGTPIYSAPEVFSGLIYSKPGDVYSFALIAYEIITNDRPFPDIENIYILINNVCSGKRPEFKNPIKESYKNLIERCWSQDPEKRPTFTEIVNVLEKPEFITDLIDSSQFNNYIDYIKNYAKVFDKTNKLVSFNEFNLLKLQKVDEKNDSTQTENIIDEYFTPEIKKEAFDLIRKFLNQPKITDEVLNKKLSSLIIENKNFYEIDLNDEDYYIYNYDANGISSFIVEDYVTKERALCLQMDNTDRRDDELHITLENNDLRFLKMILLKEFCDHPTLNDIKGFNICNPDKYFLNEDENEEEDQEYIENKKYPSILFNYVKNKTLDYYIDYKKIFELTPLQRQIIMIGLVSIVRFFHKHNIALFTLNPKMIGLDENFYPKIFNLHIYSNNDPENWEKNKFGLPIQESYFFVFLPIYGDKNSLGISDDIPVLGANLYTLITGVIPYRHPKDNLKKIGKITMLRKIMEGALPFIPENVSGPIRDLLTRCMSIDEKKRPTADEIYDRLRNSFDYYIEGLKPIDVFEIFKYFNLIETYENQSFEDLQFEENEYPE